MFTWICPQCGREVPPAYTECPDCSKKTPAEADAPPPAATTPAPPQPAPTPAPAAVMTAAPPVARQPMPAAPQPMYAPPPRARSLAIPTWLLSIIFALAFVGLGAGVWWLVQRSKGGSQAPASSIAMQTPSARTPAKVSPVQQFVEVTGVRYYQNAKKQTEVRFLVVNHSEAEITDLGGTVKVLGRVSRSDEEPVGTFAFKLPSLGPNESKELTALLDTKLKVYELPDWQKLEAVPEITSP